jgi:hypothetical protein
MVTESDAFSADAGHVNYRWWGAELDSARSGKAKGLENSDQSG